MSNALLIFGGSGFIGRTLCKKALEQGYHVYSISTHGKPDINERWVTHVNMTWIACDVSQQEIWQKKVPNNLCYCINLIGILKPTSTKTYKNSIIQPNEWISTWSEKHGIPYLFLSAKLGPIGYIRAKKEAEHFILSHHSNATICYIGLVTTKQATYKSIEGSLIKLGAQLPLMACLFKKVYPIERETLAITLLRLIKSTDVSTKFVDLTH